MNARARFALASRPTRRGALRPCCPAFVLVLLGACAPATRRDAAVVVEDTSVVVDAATPDSMPPPIEAGPDAGPDAAPDVPGDTTVDAALDVALDTQVDALLDAHTERDAATVVEAAVDAASLEAAADVSALDARDAAPSIVAFGQPCTADSRCEASAGEASTCYDRYGTPVCVESCNSAAAYTRCAGGRGICVPTGSTRLCIPKCGDVDERRCGPGASCAMLGVRLEGPTGLVGVGMCVPDCAGSGIDACATGYACDRSTRNCERPGCAAGCPSGTSCDGIMCVPAAPIALYGACDTNPGPGRSNGCAGELCVGGAGSAGFCSTRCNSLDGTTWCGAGVCWTDNDTLTGNVSGLIGVPGGGFSALAGRQSGVCLKSCVDTVDCPSGFHCSTYGGRRVCMPFGVRRGGGVGTPQPVGALCRLDEECQSNSCGLVEGYADGVCQRATPGLTCPTGTAPHVDGVTCLPTCDGSTPSQCPGSWVCDSTSHTCLQGVCRDNGDCAAGFRCDADRSECVSTPPASIMRASVGSACARNEDCASFVCIPQSTTSMGVTWSGGYCSLACTILPDFSDTCPAGSFCNASSIGVQALCLDLCDAPGTPMRYGSCRATGYRCSPFSMDPRYGVCTVVTVP